ncbi:MULTISPECIES: radical SAM/CxCxxxxC motif protein YfkAB [unclassified Paenibacillus]|uniref:radical SAM/CxCxxxxC motif protein YfkAB n=1 Tax=unclassified Paenibacillus TaxID=185978 RepID=UPI001AE45A9D|nr:MULTISPECIES: radical SAM/CxCxxxxC motif protein YfkAB [unclassified Paenibacillus]MBP1154569.1 radical SAM/CxCxxxxC motif protein YfkAB [Paenibacillus sp. PvP091]MBP1170047.1 radical SAM/CxCxxxxC motif protein YfkAB [Paenibacillus sp. PvR098]MBP2441075.1 radical SAM/CxCxxxxC motif protein YfkAB [Paenibacillus sp. PvP052]
MSERLNVSPMPKVELTPITPEYDPWDPIRSVRLHGEHRLTSIELTVTNLCNMRCEHCAVGETLTMTEGPRIPLSTILKRLDEVEDLQTISITGGEPSYHEQTVREYIVPILRYARERGVRSQINSNVTLDLSRYELMAPYLDVMHISFNYLSADDFYEVGFARTDRRVSRETAVKLYDRMMSNAAALSQGGMFVSAESMINYRTHEKLPEIHQLIREMGCNRHEVHPMYPSAFASGLPVLKLEQTREAIHRLLDHRDKELWMLFGTLPFYACSSHEEDLSIVNRLRSEPNVTVRNDPDGRNRLNVNLFTGDVFVTDFSDVPALGNMHTDRLDQVYARWKEHSLSGSVNCYCPTAACCGPNLLVVDTYYKDVDFKMRRAVI